MRKLSSSSSSNLLKGIKSSDNFQNLKENSTNPLNSPSLNDKGRLSTFKLSNNLNPFSISQNCPPSPQKNTTNLKDEHVLTGVNEKSPSRGSLMTGEEKKYLESCQSASYTSLSSNEEDNSEFSSKSFSGSGVTVKEIKKFQKLFPFLYSEGEVLFQVYTCALDKDGLWHGKLYLTNCSFGFYGKIFKKVCTIVIKFSDLVTLEKKLTAGVFPNAIKITTNSRSLVFTSFLKRDCAFKDMNEKWKDCTSSLNKFQEISTTKTADVASFVIGVEDEEVVASNVISSSGKSLHAMFNLENIKSFTKEGLNINTTMEVKLSEVEKDKRNSVSSSLNSSLGGETKSSAISSLSSSVGVSPIEISITDTEQNDLATSFKRKNTIKKGTGKSELLRKSKTDSLLDHDGINETGMQGNRAKSISPVMSPLTKLDSEIICPWEVQNVDPNGVENLKNNANITLLKNNMNLLEKFYCECESHLENEICLDQIFEMTVNELVECLFGSINTASGSKVFKEAALKSGFEDIKVGTWSLQLSKDSQREIYAFQTFKMPFLPKISTNWIERQKILRQSDRHIVMESSCKTPKLPYGETYSIINRFCITNVPSDNTLNTQTGYKTRLVITSKVDFTKKLIWKEKIEQQTFEFSNSFANNIKEEIKKVVSSHPTTNINSNQKTNPLPPSEPFSNSSSAINYLTNFISIVIEQVLNFFNVLKGGFDYFFNNNENGSTAKNSGSIENRFNFYFLMGSLIFLIINLLVLKNYSFQLKILEERHLNMQEEYKNLKVSNDLKFRKKFFGESKLENFKKSDDLNLEQEKSYEIYNQIFNNFLRYQVNEISLDIENLEKVESNIKLKFDQLKAEVDFIVDDLNNLSLSYNKKLDKKT